MSDRSSGALGSVRVLDLTDDHGAYAGRLLGVLGADVVRLEGQETGAAPLIPPIHLSELGPRSLFDEFVHAGKRSARIDLTTDMGADILRRLVGEADVLLDDGRGRAPGGWTDVNPRLVHVTITPFGHGNSPDWEPVDDLIVLGAGGLLHLGGYQDTGPMAPFGRQSHIAAGIFGAVAALAGLIEREETGVGNAADVSAQESIAQALEDSLPAYALTGKIREPQGDEAREAGTGIYACADGYVSMVAGRLGTARAWTALVEWMNEHESTARVLLEPPWGQFSFRQSTEASETFRRIFETFAAAKSKTELYVDAQRRGIALSPVSEVDDLLANEQLRARSFFHQFDHPLLGAGVIVPGPPFRLSGTPPQTTGPAALPGSDTADVLRELGLTEEEIHSLVETELV